jgi:hypothetical protein
MDVAERERQIKAIRQRRAELEQERQRIAQWHERELAEIAADARNARAVLLRYGLPVPVDTA